MWTRVAPRERPLFVGSTTSFADNGHMIMEGHNKDISRSFEAYREL